MSITRIMQLAAAGVDRPVGGLLVTTTQTFNTGLSSNYLNVFGSPYDWIVPDGVTNISAVAIGGGGEGGGDEDTLGGGGGAGGCLAYAIDIPVIPGETLSIYPAPSAFRGILSNAGITGARSAIIRLSNGEGLLQANGNRGGDATGGGGISIIQSLASAGSFASAVFSGGNGGDGGSSTGGGGGGAAGYSANGNTGLGGSGQWGGTGNQNGRGGGGVGVYGEGASGTLLGQGGSGGANGGTAVSFYGDPGGLYGGGGGGGDDRTTSGTRSHGGAGGAGAVRIIWGPGRSFPSTNTSLEDSNGNETTIIL